MKGEVWLLIPFLFLALILRKFRSEKQKENENEGWRRASGEARHTCPAPLSCGEGLGVRPGAQERRVKGAVHSAPRLRSGTRPLANNNGLGFARPTPAVTERSRGAITKPTISFKGTEK